MYKSSGQLLDLKYMKQTNHFSKHGLSSHADCYFPISVNFTAS